MVIPRKINFTQMNRYGKHMEQTYRNNFKKQVDWIGFNLSLCQRLFEKSDRKEIEFCFRDSKQFTGRSHCQARDIRKMDFAFNASLAAVNVAKVMISENGTHWSINSVKSLMYNSFILKRFIDVSGYKPNKTISEKLIGLIIELSAYAA